MFTQSDSEFSIDLPEPIEFTPRNVSEHYGAAGVAAAYCGISPPFPLPPGVWGHGWVPSYVAAQTETTVKYLELHRIRRGVEHFWVGRKSDEEILQKLGWPARAIGSPITYAPEEPVQRRPGSLLVMPLHSLEDESHLNWSGRAYADLISQIKDRFAEVVVCVYASCAKNGFWVNDFKARGFHVITGTHWRFANGLERIRTILSSFEYVTTNGFGSHLAYAAALGAKVSIFGPMQEVTAEEMKHDQGYHPKNRWLESYFDAISEAGLRANLPFLFCNPWEAQERVEWGRAEIGWDMKVSPDELRRLFRWTDRELFVWRNFVRPVARANRAAKDLIPQSWKHAIRMRFNPEYRRIQTEKARLRQLRD
jgi:hypothetical protein